MSAAERSPGAVVPAGNAAKAQKPAIISRNTTTGQSPRIWASSAATYRGRSEDQAAVLAGAAAGILKRYAPGYMGEDKITDPAALRSAMPTVPAKAMGKNNERLIGWAEEVAVATDLFKAAGKLADLEAYRAA